MPDAVLFPNALDYVRAMHDNAVDNFLAGQRSYIDMGSMYRRAHAVVNETGYVQMRPSFVIADSTDSSKSTPIRR